FFKGRSAGFFKVVPRYDKKLTLRASEGFLISFSIRMSRFFSPAQKSILRISYFSVTISFLLECIFRTSLTGYFPIKKAQLKKKSIPMYICLISQVILVASSTVLIMSLLLKFHRAKYLPLLYINLPILLYVVQLLLHLFKIEISNA